MGLWLRCNFITWEMWKRILQRKNLGIDLVFWASYFDEEELKRHMSEKQTMQQHNHDCKEGANLAWDFWNYAKLPKTSVATLI